MNVAYQFDTRCACFLSLYSRNSNMFLADPTFVKLFYFLALLTGHTS